MSAIDIEQLLQPISDQLPCGEDLEYDPSFQEMERAAQGKAETQFSEAEPPDWKDVQRKSLQVLERTRDIRPLVLTARSSLHLADWATFSDCMTVLAKWLEIFWEPLYPQLDPDDQDPEFRVNSVASIAQEPTQFNSQTFIQDVRKAPLVQARNVGQFSLHDLEIVSGKLDVAQDVEAPTETIISAAFEDAANEDIQATAQAIGSALENVQTIDRILTEQLSAAHAPDLEPIQRELGNALKALDERLQALGLGSSTNAKDQVESTDQEATMSGSSSPNNAQAFSGTINSRTDVLKALDQICDYYRREEPSSPIPLLLERAKRLAPKSFVEIIQDMAPGALPEVDVLRGQGQDAEG